MSKIDLIIDALLVAPPSVWSARMNEALFVARELKAELENRQWVGLTDNQLSETYNDLYTQYTRNDVNIVDFILIAQTVEIQLKELNT